MLHRLIGVEKPPSLYGTETIFIVENDKMVNKMVCETLTSHGYNVIKASIANEAVQLAST